MSYQTRKREDYQTNWMVIVKQMAGIGECPELVTMRDTLGMSPWHVCALLAASGGLNIREGMVLDDTDPRYIPKAWLDHALDYQLGLVGYIPEDYKPSAEGVEALRAGVLARWGLLPRLRKGIGALDADTKMDGYIKAWRQVQLGGYGVETGIPLQRMMGLMDGVWAERADAGVATWHDGVTVDITFLSCPLSFHKAAEDFRGYLDTAVLPKGKEVADDAQEAEGVHVPDDPPGRATPPRRRPEQVRLTEEEMDQFIRAEAEQPHPEDPPDDDDDTGTDGFDVVEENIYHALVMRYVDALAQDLAGHPSPTEFVRQLDIPIGFLPPCPEAFVFDEDQWNFGAMAKAAGLGRWIVDHNDSARGGYEAAHLHEDVILMRARWERDLVNMRIKETLLRRLSAMSVVVFGRADPQTGQDFTEDIALAIAVARAILFAARERHRVDPRGTLDFIVDAARFFFGFEHVGFDVAAVNLVGINDAIDGPLGILKASISNRVHGVTTLYPEAVDRLTVRVMHNVFLGLLPEEVGDWPPEAVLAYMEEFLR